MTEAAVSDRERDTLLCPWLSRRLLLLPALPLGGASELLGAVPACSRYSCEEL